MTIARKDYTCALCYGPIPKGADYHRADITPWQCAGGDPGFYTFHEHHPCHQIWALVAEEFDYMLPTAANEWPDVVECWGFKQKPPEGGFRPDDLVTVWRNLEKWFPGTRGRIGTVIEVKPDEGDGERVIVKFPNEDKPYAHSPGELALIERPAKLVASQPA